MVTVRGKVVELTTEVDDEHIGKLVRKYLGVDKYPLHPPNEKRIIVN